MMRHLTRGFHGAHVFHHGPYIAHDHRFGFYHHGGGVISWILHSVVSFAVWHALGPVFRHLGPAGSLLGAILLVALTWFIWRAIRRTAL